jgi:hypothetical protein
LKKERIDKSITESTDSNTKINNMKKRKVTTNNNSSNSSGAGKRINYDNVDFKQLELPGHRLIEDEHQHLMNLRKCLDCRAETYCGEYLHI